MPSSSPLIDHLISVGNKSGVIKGGPEALKGLKENIKDLPFEVATRGISAQWSGDLFGILLGLFKKATEQKKKTPNGVPPEPQSPSRNTGPDIPSVRDLG